VPHCGSQIVLCDLPVRFDPYTGCSHGCRYCYVRAKRRALTCVRPGESLESLRRFVAGARSAETRWCSWPIPLHIGAMSDPLQPAERRQHRTLACLELLAARRYPFVLSTKSTLAAESPWLDVLSACRAVLQISMVARCFDRVEPGAPPFAKRLAVLPILTRRVPRVVIRCQPYTPDVFRAVLRTLPRYAAVGAWGLTFEALKSRRRVPGSVKVGADWCYPVDALERDARRLRDRCRELGLVFLAAENRLRRLSDERCCCGTAGLSGFRPNTANLNTLVARGRLHFRRAMERPGSAACFKSLCQSPVSSVVLGRLSYAECMAIAARVPVYRAALGLPTAGR
jgi:DNA repair photolyase